MQLIKALFLRLAFGAVSLLIISFVTFVASAMAPGDPARYIAGEKATEAQYQRIREQMGLNKPLMTRYGIYLSDIAHGDWGKSYQGVHEPVADILKRTVPMTAKVAILAIILASTIGITLGTIAAIRENRFADRSILTISTLGVTLPNFVLAPILVYIFAVKLDRLPVGWDVELRAPEWMYLLLPVIVLSLRPMAMLTRLTRAAMVETLRQEFIRTGIAKGVPPFRLYTKYALRNAILPVVTTIGTTFGFLLTGSFVVERFFIMPGIGSRTIEAILSNDVPVVQACVLVTGAMFVLVNTIVDLLLPILDPRIREAQV
ncbi:MAG: ABC transporter permease [Armatimonadetes bacterium]|nr:ABC transporter permease subunit [Armatimonadota bacterium]MBS1700528.1 ABC transporter permease [Armatimonadota bacterium]